ncbi:TatD family hydrolase [Spongorhabdus nitratireducens]
MSHTPELIDIGVNLGDKQFNRDRDEVVERAVEAGIKRMILTGTCQASSEQVLELCQQYSPWCYSTAGIHPHDASTATPEVLKSIRGLLNEDKVVAVGETGLDFNRNFSTPKEQEAAFLAQLEMAAETGLPLFCHERDAADRMHETLKAHRDDISNAVIHCFTADRDALFRYLDLDLYIGITGWVCDERRGTHLWPLLNNIPANRLMIETDAPWLLPRTLEKKPKNRRNEPAFLSEVVNMISVQTGKPAELIAQETTANACTFFRLPAG